MSVVYIPLRDGSKQPAVSGWASPSYEGVDPNEHPRVALRADDYVIVDCDSAEALGAVAAAMPEAVETYTVKTPRGWHLYFTPTEGSPTGPMVAVMPGVDIRAGRGSYVVCPPTEGYSIERKITPRPFNPDWMPKRTQEEVLGGYAEWDTIPEGRRNITLTALAGALRRQGASKEAIARQLVAANRMCDPPLDADELRTIVYSVARYEPDPDIGEISVVDEDGEVVSEPSDADVPMFLDARDMTLPPPPEWWWKPYFPKGRLVMLDGREGIGKGMLCVLLALYTSEGRGFPGGEALDPAPVLWYAAEDDPEEDILRRLYAAGWSPEGSAPIQFFNTRRQRPRFPQDIKHLRNAIRALRPRFVILDPGRSYLSPPDGVQSSFNDEAAVRPGLEALQHLAHDEKTTIIWVHHWNKGLGDTRQKMGGSVAFLQVVRHRVTLAQVNEHRAFSVEKSNIAETAFTVHGFDVLGDEVTETGYAKLGSPLPEFRDLDEWIKTVEQLDAELDHEIFVDVGWEEAIQHYSFIPEGGLAPTAQAIATDLDVSLEEAQKIRAKLREVGVINGGGGKASRWHALPVAQLADLRKRFEAES